MLDSARFSGLSFIVALCAASILVLDGLDIQLIGIAAPDIVRDLGIDRGALAPALAAALAGMLIGAPMIGALGDRWGRRPALLLSTLLFGFATLAAATSQSVNALAAWRLVTGIGLGGALPAAAALMAEFTPRRARSQTLGAALVGVPLGGILGALLATKLMPDGSWRALFIAGGMLPILAAVVMFFFMPESPRFLAGRATRSRTLADLLNRIDGRGMRFSNDDSFVLNVPGNSAGLRALFAPDLRADTVITSLIFLTNIFAIYAFFNWGPLVLTALGWRLDEAVRSTLVFNVAGIAGSLAVAAAIARWGSRAPLAICSAAGGLTLIGLAFLPRGESTSLLAGIAIAGTTVSAVQVGMYAVAANVYPTPCRSTGIGLSLGVGRTGGILSAFAGSLLLAYAGAAGFFGAVGAVMLVTVAAVLVLQRHVPRAEQSVRR